MADCPALDVRFASGPGAGSLQDLLYAELDDFEPRAILELDSGDGWRVFFGTPGDRDAARRALAASVGGHAIEVEAVDVVDEDWARRSQAALSAIRVGRIIVAPPWDVKDPGPRTPDPDTDLFIIIEPSTGFGTGHHATTRLCLELLQTFEIAGRRVIDVGTGSGVLAIAASKLGATSVIAIDCDPDALTNARENVVRNRAAGIEIREADVEQTRIAPGDFVLANLTGAMLERAAPSLMALTTPGGVAILSGFGPDESHAIAAAWTGWSVRERRRDGDWAAVALVSQAVDATR